LDVKRHFIHNTVTVSYNGELVATASRKILSFKHAYELWVAKGTDMALIVGIVLAIDESIRSLTLHLGTMSLIISALAATVAFT
jgi:uncharacterized protein YxjI